MSFWTALVVIVAIAGFVFLKGTRAPAADREPRRREHELEREVAELRKRIAVLERIATDERRPKAIADEIESLRDH